MDDGTNNGPRKVEKQWECFEVLQICKKLFADCIWMMGDSLVFWGQQAWRSEEKAILHRYPMLSTMEVTFFGVRGLKIQCIPSLLKEKLEENPCPDVLVIHCGTNNISSDLNLGEMSQNFSDVLVDVFETQKKTQKKFKIIWSDILPWYSYKGMSKEKGLMLTTNINAAA